MAASLSSAALGVSPAASGRSLARSVTVGLIVLFIDLPALADGRVLAQNELTGVRIAFGDGSGRRRIVRIDGVTPDPKDPSGEIVLYSLSEQDPVSGEWPISAAGALDSLIDR